MYIVQSYWFIILHEILLKKLKFIVSGGTNLLLNYLVKNYYKRNTPRTLNNPLAKSNRLQLATESADSAEIHQVFIVTPGHIHPSYVPYGFTWQHYDLVKLVAF